MTPKETIEKYLTTKEWGFVDDPWMVKPLSQVQLWISNKYNIILYDEYLSITSKNVSERYRREVSYADPNLFDIIDAHG